MYLLFSDGMRLILVDPESDLAVATLGQLLLQDGRAPEALEYFDKSVELGRTEQELVSALSFAEVHIRWVPKC
jgi:mitochondrial import receptor subunit TOM70